MLQARPFLRQLRDQVDEIVHVAVLGDGLRTLYVEKLPTLCAVGRMMSPVEVSLPMHCTALGKGLVAFRSEAEVSRSIHPIGLEPAAGATITDQDAFLRELSEICSRSHAVDKGEMGAGVRCVDAPNRDRIISVSGRAIRMSVPLIDSHESMRVVDAAAGISRALGHVGDLGEFHSAPQALRAVRCPATRWLPCTLKAMHIYRTR